jgi:DNA-3-methyladenine glycosylase I
MKNRCKWVPQNDELYIKYHDEEWGVPVYDDLKLFEFITLETFQAGLSWKTVLHKRENFRKAFDQFDPKMVANYNDRKIEALLNDKGIIRNQLKIKAAVNNAQKFLEIQNKYGSFNRFIWKYIGGAPIVNQWQAITDIPVKTDISDKLSADLKKLGFKFTGSTVCYAHMQATGMVNDHTVDCFRHPDNLK